MSNMNMGLLDQRKPSIVSRTGSSMFKTIPQIPESRSYFSRSIVLE